MERIQWLFTARRLSSATSTGLFCQLRSILSKSIHSTADQQLNATIPSGKTEQPCDFSSSLIRCTIDFISAPHSQLTHRYQLFEACEGCRLYLLLIFSLTCPLHCPYRCSVHQQALCYSPRTWSLVYQCDGISPPHDSVVDCNHQPLTACAVLRWRQVICESSIVRET